MIRFTRAPAAGAVAATFAATFMATFAAAGAAFPQTPAAPPVSMRVHVDARGGSDTQGDGSVDKPFRTIHRALVLQSMVPDRVATIELGLGHYGRRRGAVAGEAEKDHEVIPVVLPPNVSLVGAGSESCELTGELDLPIVVLADHGECRLGGVTLRGGATAVAASPLAKEGALKVTCVDLAIRECADGIDLDPAAGRVTLRGDGVRIRGGKAGLRANGATRLDLDLTRSLFRECDEGIRLDTTNPSGVAAGGSASHALHLSDCRFERGAGVALRRFGAAPLAADATPWKIEGCAFVGNEAGIALEIPNGDLPFSIERCDFLENSLFGLSVVGSGEPLEDMGGASRVADCRMRWNGVGVNLLACGRKVELTGCRIEESIGNGLFVGLLSGRSSRVALTRCLLVCNGTCGVFALCEPKDGLEVALDHCTVADNRGHGIEFKSRKPGAAPLAVTRSIVAGNAVDLFHVDAERVSESLLGSGSADAARGIAVGDPRFVARDLHDFRLAPDSPARRTDGAAGAEQ